MAACSGAGGRPVLISRELKRWRCCARWRGGPGLFCGSEDQFFAAPSTEDELAGLCLEHPDATILAGATDVGLWVTKAFAPIEKFIWLGRVAGLDEVEDEADELRLGAMVSHSRAMSRISLQWILTSANSCAASAPSRCGCREPLGKHREWFADRRPSACADRAGSICGTAQGRCRTNLAARIVLHRVPQAGSPTWRIRAPAHRAATRSKRPHSCFQSDETPRRGHLLRHDGLLHHGRERDRDGCKGRFRRNGRHTETCRRGGERL